VNNIVNILKKDIEKKQGRYVARHYYKYKPKAINQINTFSNGEIHTFPSDKGCTLYTNYFKMLVKQKINYILAKEPEFKIDNTIMTTASITDMLEESLFNASLDTTAWLHLYVENNKLDWILISDKQIIPIYDNYHKNIIAIIRYWIEEKKENDEDNDDIFIVQTWTMQGVKTERIHKDKIMASEVCSHYQEETIYQGIIENIEAKNLPFIPFIPLFNNKDKESDIDGIQELLDMYNSINSGFVDNIDLFQEAIVKLKGFTGDTEELETIRNNMKKFKMVGIPQGGGDNADMDYMAIEIPVEARKTILDILKENIFKIGQGMDPDRLTGESNITNTVIKSRYSSLDMKANGTEKQLRLFYEQFIKCVNLYYMSTIANDITFNRSMIFNESEAIDNCLKSTNLLDLETILENHPWVTDAKETKAKIEQEREENIKKQQELLKDDETTTNTMNTKDLK
jgi:SPP1 family phage portal protein